MNPSGVNFVDTIHVYVKSKEAFGWPEHPPPAPAAPPSSGKTPLGASSAGGAQGEGEGGMEVMPVMRSKDCSAVDR